MIAVVLTGLYPERDLLKISDDHCSLITGHIII